MNNVNEIEESPDFIKDQRDWLNEHKQVRGLSWAQLHSLIGRPAATLSLFSSGKYNGGPAAGGNGEIAKQIYRYRQTLTRQAELKYEAPEIPGYFETRTAKEVMHLLSWAQRGRMTLWAGGPGTGKTSAAKEYAERASNVWYVEILKSTKTISALCTRVLEAMRDFTAPPGTARMSAYVMGKMRDTQGLLILDDAQHLDVDQIEEVRGWFDLTGVGVAFLGNEKVVSRMEGGARKAEFAQLYSRVGLRMIRSLPLRDDVDALAAAWGVENADVMAMLQKIGSRPGGLRSCTYAMELAAMLASGENSELELRHLERAWSQLSTHPVAA
ncbi:AAA family ATPase [Sphingobium sp. TB-6]|uniref:AAA family ATPase n=1 Tax=Sphingobium sp. TB-6 TaxID=2728850 RepID=UPI00146AB448|nr:AAA family ATPase [Sphingobium sp. TB-6]NML88371.1 AAA family ATPase [Sphingobium sp. TB-6]